MFCCFDFFYVFFGCAALGLSSVKSKFYCFEIPLSMVHVVLKLLNLKKNLIGVDRTKKF